MKKFLALVFIWGLVLGGAAVGYKYLFEPSEQEKEKKSGDSVGFGGRVGGRGGGAAGAPKIKLALDSFSGYCVFRSADFLKRLASHGIAIEPLDDKADYTRRMETIRKGETPYAVFTIDALLNQTPRDGDPPATIVMLIDETRGADALLAYQRGVPTLDALNSPRARVGLVLDSPSETLLRVVRSRFNLEQLPAARKDYLLPARPNKSDEPDGAEDIYKKLITGEPSQPYAYVLWEPYVSMALRENKNIHRLVDSADIKGMIVDVLVVQTEYLRKNSDQVRQVVRCYLETLAEVQASPEGLVGLVKKDADLIGEPNVKTYAGDVVKGIWWKNTTENYAHFGLLPAESSGGLQSLRDMIRNITEVLNKTLEPGTSSVGLSRPDRLADAGTLRGLYELKPRPFQGDQPIRPGETAAGPAGVVDWKSLQPVGQLKIEPIEIGSRGGLIGDADQILARLAENLQLYPRYYLRIEGNTEKQGDREANLKLAQRRAEAVKKYLVEEQKISAGRLQAMANEPGGGKYVTFTFMQQR